MDGVGRGMLLRESADILKELALKASPVLNQSQQQEF